MHTFKIRHDPTLGGSGFIADYEYVATPTVSRNRDCYRIDDVTASIGLLFVNGHFGPAHPDQRVALLKSMIEVCGREPSDAFLEAARSEFEGLDTELSEGEPT